MTHTARIVLAQVNFLVGDIEGNTQRIITHAQHARDTLNADLIVFPELTLTAYPPEDLLLRDELYQRVHTALETLCATLKDIDVIVGYPEKIGEHYYNQAALLRGGTIKCRYSKQSLPNYGVFDEKRYFTAGDTACAFELNGINIALSICEDLWSPGVMQQAVDGGAALMLSLNASPFHAKKSEMRQDILRQRAAEGGMPIAYINWVGGQDELVFDGDSHIVTQYGKTIAHAGFLEEHLLPLDIEQSAPDQALKIKNSTPPTPPPSETESIYNALVIGVRDYIHKNEFPSAIIGLSGGIDSALTLAIACDAIGAEHVHGVLMPSRHTSDASIEDAETQAKTLGVSTSLISIEPTFQAFLDSLADEFKGLPTDATEENIQARCRGILLMAISNKKGHIVLSTGNKSEMSVGYATLYGDMVGGFCVLKDVAKTGVYRLAHYRNTLAPIIPERVLTRAPSAELADHQTDQDSLPPYEMLDVILERFIEHDDSADEIVDAGFPRDVVEKVILMVKRNEYKRRQAPPGVRISRRAFGRDRRYPITSGFRRNLK